MEPSRIKLTRAKPARSLPRFALILLGAVALSASLAVADDTGNDNVVLDPAALGITSNATPTHQDQDSPDAYPRPSPFPISWELDIKHSDPKRIVVTLPGQSVASAFWYVTYTVTNNSDQQENYDPDKYQEIVFFPHFEMRTDDGSVIQSDHGISPVVFDAIKQREGNPNLISPDRVGGAIQIGPDHARDSVAIFPEPGLRMGRFSIFISGLWGEATPIKGPDGKNMTDAKGNEVDLHKTLMLNYHVDGDDNPNHGVLRKTGEDFIMR